MSKQRKLTILELLFASIIICCNAINSKVIQIDIAQLSFLLPGSAPFYIFTFIISNLITEGWGLDEAKKCVKQGIFCQLVATSIFLITWVLPTQNAEAQMAFTKVLGMNWIFVVADIVACLVSQFSQIVLFDRLKKWDKLPISLRNMLTILLSQLIDTFMFLGMAYGVGYKWFFNSATRSYFQNLFWSQYAIKCIIVLMLTPVFPKLVKTIMTEVDNNE